MNWFLSEIEIINESQNITTYCESSFSREREMWSKETKGLNFGFKHVTELLCCEHYYVHYNIVIICYIVILSYILKYCWWRKTSDIFVPDCDVID